MTEKAFGWGSAHGSGLQVESELELFRKQTEDCWAVSQARVAHWAEYSGFRFGGIVQLRDHEEGDVQDGITVGFTFTDPSKLSGKLKVEDIPQSILLGFDGKSWWDGEEFSTTVKQGSFHPSEMHDGDMIDVILRNRKDRAGCEFRVVVTNRATDSITQECTVVSLGFDPRAKGEKLVLTMLPEIQKPIYAVIQLHGRCMGFTLVNDEVSQEELEQREFEHRMRIRPCWTARFAVNKMMHTVRQGIRGDKEFPGCDLEDMLNEAILHPHRQERASSLGRRPWIPNGKNNSQWAAIGGYRQTAFDSPPRSPRGRAWEAPGSASKTSPPGKRSDSGVENKRNSWGGLWGDAETGPVADAAVSEFIAGKIEKQLMMAATQATLAQPARASEEDKKQMRQLFVRAEGDDAPIEDPVGAADDMLGFQLNDYPPQTPQIQVHRCLLSFS
jgi:hypothetical protein